MRHRPQHVARLVALFTALAGLTVFSRPDLGSIAFGLPFLVLGEALRFWAAGHLTKTAELVTSGPYRFTRNPLYAGRLIIFTGFCLASPLPGSLHLLAWLAGLAIFFAYYLPRKERIEPARLETLHGHAYTQYRDAVPAFFPRLTPYDGGVPQRWSWQRLHRNREGLMAAGLTAWVVLQSLRAGWG